MRIILSTIVILLFVFSIGISFNPLPMHKKVMVYDSNFRVVEDSKTVVEKESVPILEKKVEQKPIKSVNKQKITSVEKSTPKIDKVKNIQTINNEKKVTKQSNKQYKTNPAKVKESKPVKKVLTESEEIIAWNVWRSNLQNQIMNDVNMPIIPNGVIFKFTFNVDKYGRISKVQTWSYFPEYTPYAIQFIAPVIRSYQGKDILNFPEGSNRMITEVSGGWRISTDSKFSTPDDYNDIEKVRN